MFGEIMMVVGAIVGYFVMAGTVQGIFRAAKIGDSGDQFLCGIAWPISLPILCGVGAVQNISKISAPKLLQPKPKAAAYAEAPMTILAGMICQRMLASPEGCEYLTWSFKDMKVRFESDYDSPYHVREAHVNNTTFGREDFSKSDHKMIVRAWEQAKKLKDAKEVAERRAKANLAALDAIEKIAGIPTSISTSILTVEK